MNVAHVINRLDNNGVTRAVVNLAREMEAHGHQVVIIVLQTKGDEPKDLNIVSMGSGGLLSRNRKKNIDLVRRLGGFVLGGLWFYRYKARQKSEALERLLAKYQCGAVFLHCHYSKVLFSKLSHETVYYVVHNQKSRQLAAGSPLASFINRQVIRKCFRNKKLIAVSNDVKDDLVLHFDVRPDDCMVIPNVYRISEIRRLSQLTPDLRSSLPDRFILSIGRLEKQKRFDLLIEAYQKAAVDEALVIAGEGSELEPLKRLARKLGVADKVIFTGYMANPYPLIVRADFIAISSDYEGLSTVLMEALCLNKLIVTTACCGVKEWVDGVPGVFLSECGDAGALAKNLRAAAQSNLQLRDANSLPLSEEKERKVIDQYLALVTEAG